MRHIRSHSLRVIRRERNEKTSGIEQSSLTLHGLKHYYYFSYSNEQVAAPNEDIETHLDGGANHRRKRN